MITGTFSEIETEKVESVIKQQSPITRAEIVKEISENGVYCSECGSMKDEQDFEAKKLAVLRYIDKLLIEEKVDYSFDGQVFWEGE